MDGTPVFKGIVNGVAKVEIPRRHFCPDCKKHYDTTVYQAQDAISLGAWVFIQMFLTASPYLQLRIHSFREPGLDRRWSMSIADEKNSVVGSSGAATLNEAGELLVQAITDKMREDKEKKGG